MSNTGLYAKAIAGALAAAGTSAITALGDGHITTVEGVTIASAGILALGAVWAVPNTPAKVQKYGKAIAAAVLAGLGAVATAYVSGNTLHPSDLISIAIAVLGGLGLTVIVPNATVSDDLNADTFSPEVVEESELDEEEVEEEPVDVADEDPVGEEEDFGDESDEEPVVDPVEEDFTEK